MSPDVSPEQVRAALDAICKSAAFANAPRQQQLLRHLVERTLSGEVHLLKEPDLGIDIFNLPPHYDYAERSVVRATTAHIRQSLARYYKSFGWDHPVKIELPKGGFIPAFPKNQYFGEKPLQDEAARLAVSAQSLLHAVEYQQCGNVCAALTTSRRPCNSNPIIPDCSG